MVPIPIRLANALMMEAFFNSLLGRYSFSLYQRSYENFVDAIVIHIDHLEGKPVRVESLTFARHIPERRHDKPPERVKLA